jgi:hypothetical protein
VIFSVPTRENNVFLLSFHRTVILHTPRIFAVCAKFGQNSLKPFLAAAK